MMKRGDARISKQHDNHHGVEEMSDQDEREYWQDEDYYATERREEITEEIENEEITPIWDPTPSYSEDDEHMFCMGCGGESLTHPAEPRHGQHVELGPEVDNVVEDTSGQVFLDQTREPKRGNRLIIFNDVKKIWMLVKLTSGKIKYYRNYGTYHNFRADDSSKGGQYLRPGGLWGHVSPDEEDGLDLFNIKPVLPAAQEEVVQFDGRASTEDLSGRNHSVDQEDDDNHAGEEQAGPQTPREVRQLRRWSVRTVHFVCLLI